MAFINAGSAINTSSPHTHKAGTTGDVMRTVVLACIPGIAALTLFFGLGTIVNLILCSAFCLFAEAVCLRLRKRSISFYLRDLSALVTAFLLAIALPPYAPWWLLFVGCIFSIVIAKHLYGGLGFNPFNPAMIGYVVLLISFPVEMTTWVSAVSSPTEWLPLSQGLGQVFLGQPLIELDAYTGATPLDVMKQNTSVLVSDLYAREAQFANAQWAGLGWEWVNLAFLAGGIFLLVKKVFTWHAPVAMLAAITVLSGIFYDGGSSQSAGSPIFHLFSGATMFGAFFIVTDPVTSAVSNKGRLIYGAAIGAIVFIIRTWGNYPDAVAFAVLLMNFAAPFIDYYTLPRTYGHSTAKSGRIKH